MSLPINAQHQAAMLLAMQQQQQQQADFDPAAMARLQLFGGAGYPEVRRDRSTDKLPACQYWPQIVVAALWLPL
jgi:hypothetical protein